jgi:hypothetical protein
VRRDEEILDNAAADYKAEAGEYRNQSHTAPLYAWWAAKKSQSRCVANAGHWCPPPSTVIKATLRPSAQPAVEVVTGPRVETTGAPHWSTLRQNVLRSGTGGPLM